MQKFDIFKTTVNNQYLAGINIGTPDQKSFIINESSGKMESITLENPPEVTAKMRSDNQLFDGLQDFANQLLISQTRTVVDTINGHQVFLDKSDYSLKIDINGQIIPILDNAVIGVLKNSMNELKKIQLKVEGSGDNFYGLGDRVLTYGPTGTGKTYSFLQTVNNLIADSKIDNYYISTITEGFEDVDFFEFIVMNNAGVIKKERGVVQLLRDAAAGKKLAICFDELNRGSKSFMNLVLKMLDAVNGTHYEIYYAGNDEMIRVPIENLLFFATMNLGGKYTGTNSLDEALFDRFNIVLNQSYNLQVEDEIYKAFGSLASQAKEIVTHTRKMNISGEIRAPLSTRGIKAWAEKFINTSMQAKDFVKTFNIVALYRLCTVDDFGNQNQQEEMLIMSKFKELKLIS